MENNLPITDKVRQLQRKLYLKAKSQSNLVFLCSNEAVYRMDVLMEAWQRLNKEGAPGINGQTISL